MNKPKISIIAAMAGDRAIGQKGKLLWHIPAELKRFKEITVGHPIIMGRKTFESIGRPLPNRLNIVVTHDPSRTQEGLFFVSSLEEALRLVSEDGRNEIFIIGGGQIYKQALPLADKLYLTIVEGEFPEADTFFPEYSDFKKVVSEEPGESDGYKYKFMELER